MKKVSMLFIILLVVLILAACGGNSGYYPITEANVLAEYAHTEVDNALYEDEVQDYETYMTNEPNDAEPDNAESDDAEIAATTLEQLTGYIELPGKIAIITNQLQTSSNPAQACNWITKLLERHGSDNVLVYTWPRRHRNSTARETIALIETIANNPEIRVLIISPAWQGTDYIVSILRETREDIFVIYLEYNITDQEQQSEDSPFQYNTLAYASANANLILDLDVDAMTRALPEKAWALGARTLVFFYDSYRWEWDEEEFEEAYWHRFMREKSGEIGLTFVEVDINGEIQCGSSFAMFMAEVIPPLIEAHGTDTVLFGLDNERVFWDWLQHSFIYIPMPHNWFEPDPINLATGLQISEFSAHFTDDMPDIPHLIDEIRQELDERGLLGRIVSVPISSNLLVSLAATEYSIKWIHQEVPNEGIDTNALEQIMIGIIEEYTGITNHGVTLTGFNQGHIYENYILVTLDWFTY